MAPHEDMVYAIRGYENMTKQVKVDFKIGNFAVNHNNGYLLPTRKRKVQPTIYLTNKSVAY